MYASYVLGGGCGFFNFLVAPGSSGEETVSLWDRRRIIPACAGLAIGALNGLVESLAASRSEDEFDGRIVTAMLGNGLFLLWYAEMCTDPRTKMRI